MKTIVLIISKRQATKIIGTTTANIINLSDISLVPTMVVDVFKYIWMSHVPIILATPKGTKWNFFVFK